MIDERQVLLLRLLQLTAVVVGLVVGFAGGYFGWWIVRCLG